MPFKTLICLGEWDIYTHIYIIKCIEIEMYTDTMTRYKTLDADPSRNRSEFDDS